jgi:hypothetical protein
MMRVMFDSDNLDVIKELDGVAPLLATYSDLVPSGSLPLKRSVLILIDRGTGDPSGKASIADVEAGALTVAGLTHWLKRKHAAGVQFITVYCSRDRLAEVDAAIAAADLPVSVWRWVATLDGTVFMDKYAATQSQTAAMLGVHADGSWVRADGWHPTGASPGT